jgi:hypothetical protein
MRPLFEDIDEFDFDDSPHVARLLREQRLEESRYAGRKSAGPKYKRPFDNNEDEYDEFDDYEDYEDYNDYDEREFDAYAGVGVDHE